MILIIAENVRWIGKNLTFYHDIFRVERGGEGRSCCTLLFCPTELYSIDTIEEESDRREGKGRRCCLRDIHECRTSVS